MAENWAAANTSAGFSVNNMEVYANPNAASACPTGPVVGFLFDDFEEKTPENPQEKTPEKIRVLARKILENVQFVQCENVECAQCGNVQYVQFENVQCAQCENVQFENVQCAQCENVQYA